LWLRVAAVVDQYQVAVEVLEGLEQPTVLV
jgi:hypothetical protein